MAVVKPNRRPLEEAESEPPTRAEGPTCGVSTSDCRCCHCCCTKIGPPSKEHSPTFASSTNEGIFCFLFSKNFHVISLRCEYLPASIK